MTITSWFQAATSAAASPALLAALRSCTAAGRQPVLLRIGSELDRWTVHTDSAAGGSPSHQIRRS